MRKAVTITLILLCLMLLSSGYLQQIKAQSSHNNLTIGADGHVNPANSQIQQIGNSYILTNNMAGNIIVEISNIVLDGNGKTLSGGILVNGGSNVTVKNFVLSVGGRFGDNYRGFFCGLYLSDASNNFISNNTITEVTSASDFVGVFVYYDLLAGIIVAGGHSNSIIGNNLVNNDQNMRFSNTKYNLLVGNTMVFTLAAQKTHGYGYGHLWGIYFDHSSNNTVYHNNFEIDLGLQAQDSYYGSLNIWDNGYPYGGNYWADYNAKEIDNSGIGNKQYVIDGPVENSSFLNNTDRYPLMQPFNSTFYSLQTTSPEVSLLSPLNQAFDNSVFSLNFTVRVLSPVKTVSWTGYCLDGQQNVTITSNITLTGLSNGPHNITIYANDTYGNMGALQTINFTIAKPVSFPTIAVVVIISGVITAAAGLLVYFKKHRRAA